MHVFITLLYAKKKHKEVQWDCKSFRQSLHVIIFLPR